MRPPSPAEPASLNLQGRLTAHERLELLFDEGTFQEQDAFVLHSNPAVEKIPGEGVVTGYGEIYGKIVFAFAHDFTVHGGSLSQEQASKVCKVRRQVQMVSSEIMAVAKDSDPSRSLFRAC